MNVIDLLLPTTDAGVVVQVTLVASFGAAGIYLTRNHPDSRLFVIGAALLAFAFMAVRALH